MSQVEAVFNEINILRSNPPNYRKKFETVAKAFSRVKKVKEAKELESFAGTLSNLKKMDTFILSEGLCKAAQLRVKKIVETDDPHETSSKETLEERVSINTSAYFELFEMLDHGSFDNLLTRAVISDHDPDRTYRKAIFNPEYKYIGIASVSNFHDDDLTVIILAEQVKEIEREVDYGEFGDLKEIFDLFDTNECGKLDPKELKSAFLTLGYDNKNPMLFRIIDELDNDSTEKAGGISFERFRDNVTNKYGKNLTSKELRRVYDLFIDDKDADTISTNNIQRIAKALDEDISPYELKKLIDRATNYGREINFNEFYEIMTIEVTK